MTLSSLFLFDITPPAVIVALCDAHIVCEPSLFYGTPGQPYAALSTMTHNGQGREITTTLARIGGQDGITLMQSFLHTIRQGAVAEALEAHRSALPTTTPSWFINWRHPRNINLRGWEPHTHHSEPVILGKTHLTSTFYVVRGF